jgi:hypothetical protein
MILFDPVVQILALADADRLQWFARLFPQTAFSIAGNDCLIICLATVNEDGFRSPMTLQRLAKEAFGRQQITVLAEEKLDGVAETVDGSIQIHPATPDFVEVSCMCHFFASDALAPIEALQQRRKMNDPEMHGGMVDAQTAVRPSSLPNRAG